MYIGHLLAEHQTSWVGTILLVFSILVTVGVAAYLYHAFRDFKRGHGRIPISTLEEGETEFEIAPGPEMDGKLGDTEALVTRASGDDFFFDEEEEAVNDRLGR